MPSRSLRINRSTCTSATGATHAPHHVPKEWADKYAGQFDDGWDAYRQRVFARQKELGVMPAGAELSRHDPDVPDWESLFTRCAPPGGPDDGGVRRVPVAHRPPHRPSPRFPEGDRRVRQHPDHGGVRQRGQRRRRAHRHDQRAAVLQQRARAAGGQPPGNRRAGWPTTLQPLPVGLDLGGQYAVPAVEKGNLPRRSLRPVRRLLAAGHQGTRRGPVPVRAHYRHGPDRPGCARRSSRPRRSGA